MERIGKTIAETVRATLPPTWKTCVWIVEITAAVSAGILMMRYLGILPLVSDALAPFFRLFGLPGEAAMAYVSGYFVNVYSAIAVAVAMEMGPREMTILAIMVLTSHNMIVETAVQKKTGTSAVRMVLLRTLSGLFLGMLMNLLLPGGGRDAAPSAGIAAGGDFMGLFVPWLKDAALLLSKKDGGNNILPEYPPGAAGGIRRDKGHFKIPASSPEGFRPSSEMLVPVDHSEYGRPGIRCGCDD